MGTTLSKPVYKRQDAAKTEQPPIDTVHKATATKSALHFSSVSLLNVGATLSKYVHIGHDAAKSKKPTMTKQSPINLIHDPEDVAMMLSASDAAVQFGSALAKIQLVSGGDNFQVNWSDHEQNVLTLKGKKYYTVQFHFHAPSEHTVNGNARAMELHLVHQSEDGCLAVVAVFFCEGKESAFLSQFWDELTKLAPETHDHVDVGRISGGQELNSLLEGKNFRYTGSLTTPPYTEGVEWVVVDEMLEASPEQLALYRKFLPSPNARDVQALNDRKVSLCQCSNVVTRAA
ncbi:hypothetical protein BBJ29_004522 [Phytophthora kernoviae]|uniref:carbonic anhydrase n=1 Tax=Phytophthora kernoviae TaxID=325452 RepID=A0A3F2RWH2_9STRA|nr:hypothetical protein BBJ29_004522 [Phytophthora kernoviae]RLN65631.1 hypothetical protein BBP00_00002743 [Phytophthora kernoviae]